MAISLDDALERAQLMCDDSLHLNQQSYEQLVDKLDDNDIYPFTMGLVERGIMVKAAKTKRSSLSLEDKLVKAAQSYKQSPSGLWVPDTALEADQPEDTEVTPDVYPEDGAYESFLDETPFAWPSESAPGTSVDPAQLKETLENAGIRITPDGKVELYRSNIPGIFTDKLPQGALPLNIAVKYFDQMMDATDAEQTKLDNLLDLFTRLDKQTEGMQASLEELNNYNYSAKSTSGASQAIAEGLDTVRSMLAEGNWNGAQRVIEELVSTVDSYAEERSGAYDTSLETLDALDRLADLQNEDPEAYQWVVDGMGGMPLAASTREAYAAEPDMFDADELTFVVSEGYIKHTLDEVSAEYPDDDVPSVEKAISNLKSFADNGITIQVMPSDSDVFEATATYYKQTEAPSQTSPGARGEDTTDYDFVEEPDADMDDVLYEIMAYGRWM